MIGDAGFWVEKAKFNAYIEGSAALHEMHKRVCGCIFKLEFQNEMLHTTLTMLFRGLFATPWLVTQAKLLRSPLSSPTLREYLQCPVGMFACHPTV
jgi:hypothetical protein